MVLMMWFHSLLPPWQNGSGGRCRAVVPSIEATSAALLCSLSLRAALVDLVEAISSCPTGPRIPAAVTFRNIGPYLLKNGTLWKSCGTPVICENSEFHGVCFMMIPPDATTESAQFIHGVSKFQRPGDHSSQIEIPSRCGSIYIYIILYICMYIYIYVCIYIYNNYIYKDIIYIYIAFSHIHTWWPIPVSSRATMGNYW